jgi:glycosyltransferase involved in cell wall biosynthesis
MRKTLAAFDPARDWALAVSSYTRNDFCAHVAVDPDRVFVVPLAADAGLFHPIDDADVMAGVRARHQLGRAPYVLSVGTIEPRKNLAHLIDAFADLVERGRAGDDLILVIAGATGWKATAVDNALTRLSSRVRGRIRLLGPVPDTDLAPLYSGADAFVYPSHFEGFGLPVLEAMQCGAPVVTTTGGALPEVAGKGALLVDPRDRSALVAALIAARRNRGLAAAGRARAAEFRWSRTLDLTVAAYRIMLSV